MKKTIQNTINFLKKIILWLLKHFGLTFHTATQKKTKETIKEITPPKKIEQTKHTIPIDTNTDTNTTRDLKKEYFHNKEIFLPLKEDLERIMFNFIEKTFKLKIRNLPISLQKELQEYQTKTIQKLIPKITKQEITSKEKVEKALEKNLKEDLQKKSLEFKTLIKKPNLYVEQKKTSQNQETIETKQNKNDNESKEEKVKETSSLFEQIIAPILLEKELVSTPLNKAMEEITEQIEVQKQSSIKTESKTLQKTEENQETIFHSLNPEIQSNSFIEKKENTIEEKIEKTDKEDLKKQEYIEKKDFLEKEPQKKEEKTPEIFLNLTVIEQENNTLIEKAKQEYNKEELIQKNYEKMEKLLEEKIREIEKMLEKALNEIQKNKLKRELNKLKKTKEQLYLYKEKDLEELRISLEENIPLDDLLLVTEKLKQLTETEEIKKKQCFTKILKRKRKEKYKKWKKY